MRFYFRRLGNLVWQMRSILWSLLAWLLVVSAAVSIAKAETRERIALVIGNSSYEESPLPNPINDATDLAAALGKLGFQVELLRNADRRQMATAVRGLSENLRKSGGVGLFFFAGHGMQIQGSNYLIPIGAKIGQGADAEYEAVNATWVLDTMQEASNRLNMIFLDACRNNPFARNWRSGERGLAPMYAGRGALIAYATQPGNVAADGTGRNSPYTKALLRHLQEPSLARIIHEF